MDVQETGCVTSSHIANGPTKWFAFGINHPSGEINLDYMGNHIHPNKAGQGSTKGCLLTTLLISSRSFSVISVFRGFKKLPIRLCNCHSPKSLLAPLRLGICLVQIVQGHVLATIPYDSNNTSDTNGATKDWSSFG